MTTPMKKTYSVGGIHPTEGALAYSACMSFRTRDDAELFKDATRHLGWAHSEVMTDAEIPADKWKALPPVHTIIQQVLGPAAYKRWCVSRAMDIGSAGGPF